MSTRVVPMAQVRIEPIAIATISAAILLAHRAEIERAERERMIDEDAERACREVD